MPGALADVLTGAISPCGTLPFEVPRSVEASQSDVADDTADPLYGHGAGLRYDGDGPTVR